MYVHESNFEEKYKKNSFYFLHFFLYFYFYNFFLFISIVICAWRHDCSQVARKREKCKCAAKAAEPQTRLQHEHIYELCYSELHFTYAETVMKVQLHVMPKYDISNFIQFTSFFFLFVFSIYSLIFKKEKSYFFYIGRNIWSIWKNIWISRL